MTHPADTWHSWLLPALLLFLALALALLVHHAGARRVKRSPRRLVLLRIVLRTAGAVRATLVVAAVSVLVSWLHLPESTRAPVRRVLDIVLLVLVGWLLVAVTKALEDSILMRYRVDVPDNLEARQMETRIVILRRIAVSVIVFVTAGMVLMTFPGVRQIGTSLLASAGIAGIIVGMAARPALSNLIAGIQVAMAQPIRLDDVVIVEGEWGRIEEVTTTYVVVRIWDLRRLIVPLSYFMSQPFQNWTRQTADLLGTVFLYVDYTVPVEEVRQELHRVLESSGMWDGKVWGLQVTNTSERAVELRALMSAPDASNAWDLRCHVRERLVAFVQEKYPHALPRARAEIGGPMPGAGGSADAPPPRDR